MKFIKEIIVGNSECPFDPETVAEQIVSARRRADEDNEHFDWNIKYFSVGIFDGKLWLVGYEA